MFGIIIIVVVVVVLRPFLGTVEVSASDCNIEYSDRSKAGMEKKMNASFLSYAFAAAAVTGTAAGVVVVVVVVVEVVDWNRKWTNCL
jgi:hypothetical protein